jgi:hypothetical protein
MNIHIRVILLFIILSLAINGYTQEAETQTKPQISVDNNIYYIQVRVIFAGTTGIYGNVGRDLIDMRKVLNNAFKYPTYTLNNTIRLSVFSGEEADALVFPEHYLKIIPRASASDGSLKAKIELYHIPDKNNDTRTDLYLRDPERRGGIRYQEKEKSDKKPPVFPIMSSAMALNQNWDAFGGVPIRVDSKNIVRSNSLSTANLSTGGSTESTGQQKYLILGIKLEETK